MNSTGQTVELDSRKGSSLLWPTRILGPPPGIAAVNVLCWGLFVIMLLIPISAYIWIQAKHGAMSITQLHSDFVYFYGDGKIAREYPSARIYDYNLQLKVFTAIYPAQGGSYGPSPYPPWVPLFFEPFARLSFEHAFVLWLGISLAFYIAGIAATCMAVFPGERSKISLILCFALAFLPFLFGNLLNGHLASIAILAVGLAIYQDRKENSFLSGLALALLSYKPTLLLLVLPMLLLTRRFRVLCGFITGLLVLILASTMFLGFQVWPAYVNMMRYFGRVTGVGGTASHLVLWKYLDLNSFLRSIHSGIFAIDLAILASIISAVALVALWWKSARCGRSAHWLAWAAALTWTLLLNIYVPIYDSLLVVIALILTLGVLRDLRRRVATEWTTLLAVLIFFVSWATEPFAKAHGIQLLTIGLLVLGTAQLVFLYWAIRQSSLAAVSS